MDENDELLNDATAEDTAAARRPAGRRVFTQENLWDDVTTAVSRLRVSDWTVTWRQRETWQLYLVGTQTESVRLVRTEHATVEVFVDHDGQRGTASVTFLPGDRDRFDSDLAQAIEHARAGGNPPWPLAGPASAPEVNVADPDIESDPRRTLLDLRDHALLAVADEPGCILSSLELYLGRGEVRFQNSRGALGVYPETNAFLDVVLLAKEGNRAAESHLDRDARGVELLDVGGAIAQQAEYARDGLRVRLPKTRRGPVILRPEALQHFFTPVLTHAHGETVYQKASRLELGQPIWGEGAAEGDALHITGDPTLALGWLSSPFDSEGLPARRTELVRGGVLVNQWSGTRYAHYLGMPPTGRFGNTVVGSGEHGIDALRAMGQPVYEIVEFSAFSPNDVTGAFVAEIKLGYEHDASGRHPIKGGSVAGNVFTALKNARFSSERAQERGYVGPAAVWLGDVTVSGE